MGEAEQVCWGCELSSCDLTKTSKQKETKVNQRVALPQKNLKNWITATASRSSRCCRLHTFLCYLIKRANWHNRTSTMIIAFSKKKQQCQLDIFNNSSLTALCFVQTPLPHVHEHRGRSFQSEITSLTKSMRRELTSPLCIESLV